MPKTKSAQRQAAREPRTSEGNNDLNCPRRVCIQYNKSMVALLDKSLPPSKTALRARGATSSFTSRRAIAAKSYSRIELGRFNYDARRRLGLCSKVPIVNGGYRYLAINGTDPSGFVSGFFVHPDVLICWSGLRTIANAWHERGHSCAATRLFDFLNGRSSPSCPSSCVSELKNFDGFPPSGCMQHFIAPIGKCGNTASHNVAFRGSHNFATDNSAWFETTIGTGGSDLYLAFANISWLAKGNCKIACNGCVGSFSCCRCNYDCNLTIFVDDRYDFCDSNPPGLSRYHPLRCACYLQNVLGLDYNQMCKYTTVKSGDALFCPGLVAKPNPPCESRSSSGHGPETW
jgi:hypothetical protein